MRRIQPLLAATLFFSGVVASACGISQTQDVLNDPHRNFERATYVVLATVVSATRIDRQSARLELQIQRSLKGPPDPTITLLNFLGSDCSQWLDVGQTYLIFARPASERVNDQYMMIGLKGEDVQRVLQQLSTSN
jgi:hypothetical protein